MQRIALWSKFDSIFLRHTHTYTDRHTEKVTTTRKMVPITGRARSFLVFLDFQNQNSEVGGQNNNNRPINLL